MSKPYYGVSILKILFHCIIRGHFFASIKCKDGTKYYCGSCDKFDNEDLKRLKVLRAIDEDLVFKNFSSEAIEEHATLLDKIANTKCQDF